MKTIHTRFLDIARELSHRLHDALAEVGPLPPLEPQREMVLADALCRSVAGQQLSVRAASTIWRRVLERAEGRPLQLFLKDVQPEVLRACGLSGAKSQSMRAIAEAHYAGQLDALELGAVDREERSRVLTSLRGVGPWTADMVSIFHFAEPDVWPDGDVTARKSLERLTSRRRKTTRTAARFAPDRSLLARYMWRHADASPD